MPSGTKETQEYIRSVLFVFPEIRTENTPNTNKNGYNLRGGSISTRPSRSLLHGGQLSTWTTQLLPSTFLGTQWRYSAVLSGTAMSNLYWAPRVLAVPGGVAQPFTL